MKFSESSEVEKSVLTNFTAIIEICRNDIGRIFGSEDILSIEWEFCYIPIVMSEEFIDFYPERRTICQSEKRVYFSPQLNYFVFLKGSQGDRLREYISGMIPGIDELVGLAIDVEQAEKLKSKLMSLISEKS